jgi:hypothetical protein
VSFVVVALLAAAMTAGAGVLRPRSPEPAGTDPQEHR